MSFRCFVAITLPDNIVDALDQLQSDLPVGDPVESETFHVTLAFLDTQPVVNINQIHDLLTDLKSPCFPLSIRGVDVFGGATPRLIWAGIDPNEQLLALRSKIRRSATLAGIELPHNKFRPHITLSRVRGRLRGDDPIKLERFLSHHAAFRLPEFKVETFSLFRSTLHPTGALHENLADYSLTT